MPFVIQLMLVIAGAYLAAGVPAAVWLHARLGRMDEGVRGAGPMFRLLVTPGLVALWPFLLRRANSPGLDTFPDPNRPVPAEALRRRHGRMVQALLVVTPLVCSLALASRRDPVADASAAAAGVSSAFPRVRSEWSAAGPHGEVRHRLRSDRFGWHWQVEVQVAGDLPFDDAMLYWMSGREDGGPAQFVGSLRERGVRRFAVPAELAERGDFVVVSVAETRALGPAGG